MEGNPTRNTVAPTDGDLLRAFAEKADQDAFAELVGRHGPLVLGVCRRVLADAPDADDAFQATFLILARKARTVRQPDRLGSWLYGVALRCAFRARASARRAKEQPMTDMPAPAVADTDWADVRPVLDAEIGRLPDKLRTALVLCELQGLDRETAATKLGIPVGTLSSRLSRAKDALRRRLIRRGITLSAAALALILAQAASAAVVPPNLAAGTVASSAGFAAGGTATATARPAVLAAGVLHALLMQKVVTGVVIGAVAVGLIVVAFLGGRAWLRSQDDRVRIQGQWQGLSFKHQGVEVPGAAGGSVSIDEAKLTLIGVEAPYTLDPSKSPKAIDVVFPGGPGEPGMLFRGVYELTDDRLIILLAEPDALRPSGLDDPRGYLRMELERAKE